MDADPLIGQEIDHFKVLKKLGEGGMGAVYLAQHPVINKQVAIKLIHAKHAANPEMSARFFREAKAISEVSHPNVIEILNFGQTPEGDPFIVMEHLKGRALSAFLTEGEALSVAALGHIALQICSALYAVHKKGVIHRDLKPDNVFLCDEPENFVKLLDFGIAKFVEPDQLIKTNAGIMLGTPAYMSPEQAAGKAIDEHTDQYSLGVLLYRMATGSLPFTQSNRLALATSHALQKPPPPQEKNPSLPTAVAKVIERCLEKDKALRYASMKDLAFALAQACSLDLEPYFSTKRPRTTGSSFIVAAPTAKAPSMRPRLALAGVLLLMGLGASAALVLREAPLKAKPLSPPVIQATKTPQVAPAPAASLPVAASTSVPSPEAPKGATLPASKKPKKETKSSNGFPIRPEW